jgi:CubicO group peptidase (beta-lactamase class C family)
MPIVKPWELWCSVIVFALTFVANFHSAPAATASGSPPGEINTTEFAQFIRDYAQAHHFNGSIRIEEDGKSLFNGSFGVADRAFNIPCTDDTRYKIASITKAFTAVLALQLAQEMKIDLDRPIKQYHYCPAKCRRESIG